MRWLALGGLVVLIGMSRILGGTVEGIVTGHLKILSTKEVQLAEETPGKFTSPNYSEFPLVIVANETRKEITRVTPDKDGYFKLALPPGKYILDLADGPRTHRRTKPQNFTIRSGQTSQVDLYFDPGVR